MRDAFPDKTDAAFIDEMLSQINNYRQQHGAAPLTIDLELMEYSKSRAAKMSAAGGISHDDLKEEYGENASWQATSSGPAAGPASVATSQWYGEVKDFNFKNPEGPHGGVTGHFTALVWKGTTKLGVGRVAGQGSKWFETFIVANFYPAGNMIGDFAANVSPKQS
ncbi:CAP family protein [Actinoplanes sp. NPDC000266]